MPAISRQYKPTRQFRTQRRSLNNANETQNQYVLRKSQYMYCAHNGGCRETVHNTTCSISKKSPVIPGIEPGTFGLESYALTTRLPSHHKPKYHLQDGLVYSNRSRKFLDENFENCDKNHQFSTTQFFDKGALVSSRKLREYLLAINNSSTPYLPWIINYSESIIDSPSILLRINQVRMTFCYPYGQKLRLNVKQVYDFFAATP